MFGKGSRYRKLRESSPIDAKGERLRGKDLRLIPRLDGSFLHTVREGERLDLLAFKYYGDPTRWWQLSDANPETPYPPDLLDRRPHVTERLVLSHKTFLNRFGKLLEDLDAFGQAVPLANLSEPGATAESFLLATIVVVYPESSATRTQIVKRIAHHGFNFLRAAGRTAAEQTSEAFTFDDVQAKTNWQALVAELAATPGVVELHSDAAASLLELTYNSVTLSRAAIITKINARDFTLTADSVRLSRTGAKIVVPPNQIT
ncbi:MAG TPA: hypothetical protein VGV59_19445 [Pyrinomonadaceae bacterium]|nr:hypothetical protein [Pyrinomonadaceae bacterium]